MALDQISATTQEFYVPLLKDNILRSNPTLIYMARKEQKIDGGSVIRVPVVLGLNTSATSYSGADTFDLSFDEEITAAEFNWVQYVITISITGLDDIRNNGGRAVLNLIRSKLQIAEASLRNRMGVDLQGDGTGNNNKNLVGLKALVDDGTNYTSYGNLSRTVYPSWGGQLYANGGVGRACTLNLMNNAFESAVLDNARPNLLTTTHAVYTHYMLMLQPQMRYSDARLADMGFSNLKFQNRPLVVDEQIPTSPTHKIWMLNTDHIDLYVHRERNFRFVPFQVIYNQDVAVAKILWAGALAGSEPRLNVQLTDLDPTLNS